MQLIKLKRFTGLTELRNVMELVLECKNTILSHVYIIDFLQLSQRVL